MLNRQHFLSSLLCGCTPPNICTSPIQLYSKHSHIRERKKTEADNGTEKSWEKYNICHDFIAINVHKNTNENCADIFMWRWLLRHTPANFIWSTLDGAKIQKSNCRLSVEDCPIFQIFILDGQESVLLCLEYLSALKQAVTLYRRSYSVLYKHNLFIYQAIV